MVRSSSVNVSVRQPKCDCSCAASKGSKVSTNSGSSEPFGSDIISKGSSSSVEIDSESISGLPTDDSELMGSCSKVPTSKWLSSNSLNNFSAHLSSSRQASSIS